MDLLCKIDLRSLLYVYHALFYILILMSSHSHSSPFSSSLIYVKNIRVLLSCGVFNRMYFRSCKFLLFPYLSLCRPTISGELPQTRSKIIVVGSPCISKIVRYRVYIILRVLSHFTPHPWSHNACGGDSSKYLRRIWRIGLTSYVPPPRAPVVEVGYPVSRVGFVCL